MITITAHRRPPRKDRRYPVRTHYAPSLETWRDIATIAEALDNAGLVAELVVKGLDVTLYAANREKTQGVI